MDMRIQYSEAIEPLVQFIEEATPENILEKTMEKLRSGISIKEISIASALAVIRSSAMPSGHHGGPLHPIAGLYAVNQMALRLSGERRFLPVLQNVALANKHIHHLSGSYLLPKAESINAGGVEAIKQAFFEAVKRGSVDTADQHFLWLAQKLPREQALDALLTVAIPRNLMDDHKLIFPVYTWKFLEWINWEYLQVLLRGPARYVSQPPGPGQVKEWEAKVPDFGELIEKYQLLSKPLRQTTGVDETEAMAQLRSQLNHCAFADIPEMLAKALAEGLSLEGTGEGLSLAASDLFLRLNTNNPMDVHMNTGANVRRHLLRIEGVSRENKILALLTWSTGPEVKPAAHRLASEPYPHSEAIAAIPRQSQPKLLWAIQEAITANEVEPAITLTEKYGELEYDIQALSTMLAEIACQDNFTEMHALKHHQAAVEEFQTTRAPFRFRHLVAAAKAASISYGKAQETYELAKKFLNN